MHGTRGPEEGHTDQPTTRIVATPPPSAITVRQAGVYKWHLCSRPRVIITDRSTSRATPPLLLRRRGRRVPLPSTMVTQAPAAACSVPFTPTPGSCCPPAPPPDPVGVSLALDATVAAEAPLSSLPDHPVTRALADDSLGRRWLLPTGPRWAFAGGDDGACGRGGGGDAVGRPGGLTPAGLAEAVGVVADLTTPGGCVVQQINMMVSGGGGAWWDSWSVGGGAWRMGGGGARGGWVGGGCGRPCR